MSLEKPDSSTICSLLRDFFHGDQDIQRKALCTLSQYETQPGFFSCLMDLITSKEHLSGEDRFLASHYLKRAVILHWGNGRENIYGPLELYIQNYCRPLISRSEKKNLRNKLLSHLREENNQIAKMFVDVIAKIACSDYPREWPELFSVLAEQLEKGDLLTSRRILEVFSLTIPTLLRKACPFKIFSRLFDYCWELCKKEQEIVSRKTKSFEENPFWKERLDLTFERWFLCLSIIQMLIIFKFQGVARFVKVPPVKEVCRMLIGAVESLVPFYSIFQGHVNRSSVHKTCVKLMEGFVEILKWHSTSFGDDTVRDDIVKFCLDTIMDSRHEKSLLFEQFLIECMVTLKSVLHCFCNQGMDDLPNIDGKRAIPRFMKRNILLVVEFLPTLPSERVKDLCKILITRYFPLTENDLKEWSKDPEMFYVEYHELDRNAKLRRHAEALFIEVFKSYNKLLRPVVISILQDATNDRASKETDSNQEMRLREAAYTAVALLDEELFDKLEFQKLYKEVLHPELYNDQPHMGIIHWKIALILQKWVLEIKGDMRKQVLSDLLQLLEYDNLVVRLAACQPLQHLVAEFDFQEEDSMYMLHSLWARCFPLLEHVRDFCSKNRVLKCILSGIINFGEHKNNSGITSLHSMIFPYANQLAYEIEKAWQVLNANVSFEFTILRALRYLSKHEIFSPVCCKILRSIVKRCTMLEGPNTQSLLTDRLLIWESTISNTLSCNSQLLELFPYLQEVMKNTFDYCPSAMDDINDHLPVAIKIIDHYINLGGGRFLSEHASVVHKLLVVILGYLDLKLKYIRGDDKMDTGVFNFGASTADRLALKDALVSDALKDTKKSVEQEDEKNIGALDEIKEMRGCSSSSEFSKMRAAESVVFKDLKKLEEISIRLAGMTPAGQSVSASIEELRATLVLAFVKWRISCN